MTCCSNPGWKRQVANGALAGISNDIELRKKAAAPPPSDDAILRGVNKMAVPPPSEAPYTPLLVKPVMQDAAIPPPSEAPYTPLLVKPVMQDAAIPPPSEAPYSPLLVKPFRDEAASKPIDKIFLNGTFLLATPSVAGETVTAVAVAGDTIADVGDAARITKASPSATQIDLKGTVLSPGFIEAHAHIISAVQTAYAVDLSYRVCATYQDVLATIGKTIAAAVPVKGVLPWFFFINFDPSMLGWTQQGFYQLGFTQLDAIPNANNCCIFVENASGHIAYANTNSFTVCKITTSSNPGDGGSYGVGTNGQLNGVMYEPSSFTPFLDHAPPQSAKSVLDRTGGFLAQCQQVGVTTVCDPAVGIGGALPDELKLYAMLASGEFATDVVGSVELTSCYGPGTSGLPAGLTAPTAPGGNGSFGPLIVPAMKLWTDGSTQGYTAYLTQPYLTPVTPAGLPPNGSADWTQTELTSLVKAARAANWSCLLHCNGDAGLDLALTSLQALAPAGGKAPFRDRIEHCTVTEESQYDTMQSLGLSPTYLNNHIYVWGDVLNEHILGNARASRLDAAGDALKRGMPFSFHCDYSVSQPDPLRYMQTAVTRTTSGGTVLGAEYAVSAAEALKGVTIYPAQQLGIDALVGSIAQGKRANLVQLAQDPTRVPAADIASVQVLGTYLRGEWKAGPSAPAPKHVLAPSNDARGITISTSHY